MSELSEAEGKASGQVFKIVKRLRTWGSVTITQKKLKPGLVTVSESTLPISVCNAHSYLDKMYFNFLNFNYIDGNWMNSLVV